MSSIFGGKATKTPSTQPASTHSPTTVNSNRLVGPIKGLDYMTTEIPIEVLLMIAEKLLGRNKPRNFKENQLALHRLSLVSRTMNKIFEPWSYAYNNFVIRSFGSRSSPRMMGETAVTPAIPWAILNNSLGTIDKAIKYNGCSDIVNLITLFPDLRRHFSYSFIGPFKKLATPLQFVAMSHGTNPAMIQALVQRGASLDEWRGYGETPLFIAVENGNWQMVVTLLELGARVHPRGEKFTAAGSLPPELLRRIINWKGGIIAPSQDFYASRGRAIRLLIKKHPELNLEQEALRPGYNTDRLSWRQMLAALGLRPQTLLTGLIRRLGDDHDALEMIKLLLKLGVEPNAQERHTGQLPLVIAMMEYRDHFLAYHNDNATPTPEQKADMGRCMRRCVHAMELLLDKGAVVDSVPIPPNPGRDTHWVPLMYLSMLSRDPSHLQTELALNLMYVLWQYHHYNTRKIELPAHSLYQLRELIYKACQKLGRVPFHV